MNEILELTWDTWLKCFWWTFLIISLAKVIIYRNNYYGKIGFFKWIKGKPLFDFIIGFGLTSIIVLLGVDMVPLSEELGWNLGGFSDIFNKLSNNPIKFNAVATILIQAMIYVRRNKKTSGGAIYGITPPPSPPPPPKNDPDN